jgi:mono/diheme cytochrome c family protein
LTRAIEGTFRCLTLATLLATGAAALGSEPETLNAPGEDDVNVINEGKRLYLVNGCYACHGIDARGTIGPDLTQTGKTDREIFARITNGKEGTAMAPFRDKIVPEDIKKIVTYLRSLAKP